MTKKLHFNKLKADGIMAVKLRPKTGIWSGFFSILNLFCSLASRPEKSHRSLFEGPLFDMSAGPPERIGTSELQSQPIRGWGQITPTAHRLVPNNILDIPTPVC